MTESEANVGWASLIFEILYRPVAWGLGVVLLSWFDFASWDFLTAFIVGFCVGVVHDLALWAFGVINYREKIVATRLEIQFDRGLDYFSKSEWDRALPVFLGRLRLAPGNKKALYFAIRCYEGLCEWGLMEETCQRYLNLYPRDKEVLNLLKRAQEEGRVLVQP